MAQPLSINLQQAIAALGQAHHDALHPMIERKLPYQGFTMYQSAADELTQYGLPHAGWDEMKLVLVFHGLIMLPSHALFADLILHTLSIFQHEYGSIPPMIAPAFEQYIFPDDTWLLPLLHTTIRDGLEQRTVAPNLISNPLAWKQQLTTLMLLQVLGVIGNQESVALLLRALQHSDQRYRSIAAIALGSLQARTATSALIALTYTDFSPEIISTLGKLGTSEASQRLLAMLVEQRSEQAVYFDNYRERSCALLSALASTADTAMIAQIEPFLTVPDPRVQISAARALYHLGDPRGAYTSAKKRKRADDEDEALDPIGRLAGQALLDIMIDRFQNDPHRFFSKQRDVAERYAQLRELRSSGTARHIPFLEWVTQHDFAQIDAGWCMAEEARRTILHIQAREHKRSVNDELSFI